METESPAGTARGKRVGTILAVLFALAVGLRAALPSAVAWGIEEEERDGFHEAFKRVMSLRCTTAACAPLRAP